MIKMYTFMVVLIIFSGLGVLKMHVFPAHKADWLLKTPIAHRGLFDNDNGVPENSLLAFKKAVERGYAIEFDVMLSKDGKVVVHHDHDLQRLSGVDKRLDSLTLTEIQFHTLLESQESAPSLKQVLELVDGQVPVYIEIKRENYAPAGPLEEKVAKILDPYEGRVAVLSFNPNSLEWFAQNAPQYYRGQNYEPSPNDRGKTLSIFKAILEKAWVARAHFMVYNHAKTPGALLHVFSFVRDLISYNVNSKADYELATLHAKNVIFEKLNL